MLDHPIIFFKELSGNGGPESFQKKFIYWLKTKKIKYDFLNVTNIFKSKTIIINSGTFNLPLLLISIIFKTKLVHRLDGFYDFSNIGRNTRTLKCFCTNIIMQFIRKYLADHIIYQSLTSKKLWDKNFNKVKTNYSIIHNPSFNVLSNLKTHSNQNKYFDIVIVEGNIEDNLFNNRLFEIIYNISSKINNIRNVYIFGNIQETLKTKLLIKKKFIIKNIVSHNQLKRFYMKNNIIFFGIEFNPCCSNSIIEANSFGIPSITLNTGSYKELIKNSGIQINFKSINDKNLEKQFLNSLFKIMKNYQKYNNRSYINASKFNPNLIFQKYIDSIRK
jgi:hypothetical protein